MVSFLFYGSGIGDVGEEGEIWRNLGRNFIWERQEVPKLRDSGIQNSGMGCEAEGAIPELLEFSTHGWSCLCLCPESHSIKSWNGWDAGMCPL